MNRRTFLGLIPAMPFVPRDLAETAAAFAKKCEERSDIKSKTFLYATVTIDDVMVAYSDGTCEFMNKEVYESRFGG